MEFERKTIILLALAIFLVVALYFVFANFAQVQEYFEQQKLQAEVRKLEQPYREDTYGGSTPEETYSLFIQALNAGDIELAAKYFSPKRQADWLKELQTQENTLDEFIASLPSLEEFEKNIVADDHITYSKNFEAPEEIIEFQGNEFTIPAGPRTYQVIFYKNEYTNKWKIEDL